MQCLARTISSTVLAAFFAKSCHLEYATGVTSLLSSSFDSFVTFGYLTVPRMQYPPVLNLLAWMMIYAYAKQAEGRPWSSTDFFFCVNIAACAGGHFDHQHADAAPVWAAPSAVLSRVSPHRLNHEGLQNLTAAASSRTADQCQAAAKTAAGKRLPCQDALLSAPRSCDGWALIIRNPQCTTTSR